MTNFSTDADLIKWEPDIFRLAKIPTQKLYGSSTASTAAEIMPVNGFPPRSHRHAKPPPTIKHAIAPLA